MKKPWVILAILFLLALLLSCSPGTGLQEKPATEKAASSSPVAEVKQGWEKDWGQLQVSAKKEGKLSILFGSVTPQVRTALIKKFSDRFGVTIDSIAANPGEIVQKLMRERSAGLFSADLMITGPTLAVTTLKPGGVIDPLKPALLLPDLTQPEEIKKVWYGGELGWVDREQKYVLGFLAYAASDLAINTGLIKLEELKSYRDILNPKWKGKITQLDPTIVGNGNKWFQVFGSKILGLDYMRELVKQEPVVMRDQRLQVEWLARGKNAIAIAPQSDSIKEFQRLGSPLYSHHPVEGSWLTTGVGTAVLVNKAPHPAAARLFINWVLSREGVITFTESSGNQSARLDVPTDFLDTTRMREPGLKYLIVDVEDFLLAAQEYTEIAKQMYAPLLK